MSASATKKAMAALHKALADTLHDQITNGTVTEEGKISAPAAVLSVARQFLKDNGIEATADSEELQKLGSVASKLPFSQPDDYGLPQ